MKEDVWVPSSCSICFNYCAILGHRVNGVLVKIEGNPDSPAGLGKLCPRGVSGIMLLYDPNRVNYPLKRTNPEKGIGIDPKWVRITWEEALNIITEKLKEARAYDPRSLCLVFAALHLEEEFPCVAFSTAFGSPNFWDGGAGKHCGNAEHLLTGTVHSAWHKDPDYKFCNYLIVFGAELARGIYHIPINAQHFADARVRGMKLVVFDPSMNITAEKADEWIPIRPGTDGIVALAMLNLLLNEFGIYDAEALKKHTNAPYLVKPDGLYITDGKTNKSLVWDSVEKKAKLYDDLTIKDFALEGTYEVQGVECKPAFQLLREHVKKYTPEEASKVSTVPAETIRRIAREYGEAARIGSRIVLDGKELPYRPAAVFYFKGAQSHRHATLTSMSINLLNQVVGNCEAVGGLLGSNPISYGHPDTGRPSWSPSEGPNGLMATAPIWLPVGNPYPPPEAKAPNTLVLSDLWPLAMAPSGFVLAVREPEKFKIPYECKVLMFVGSNPIMTYTDPNKVAEALKKIPFIVSFSLYLDETTEFSDIVLPDGCYLERLEFPHSPFWTASSNPVIEDWVVYITQPVVKPFYERRSMIEVVLELADRIGIRGDMYMIMNQVWGIIEPYRLDPAEKYTLEEITDRIFKSWFGPEHGLEYFKKHGFIKWPKKVEERYWRHFQKWRVPIYFEHFIKVGNQVKKVLKENGLENIGLDTDDYQALPDWKPCPAYEVRDPEYDLYGMYYKVPIHTFSSTYNNAWLDEVSQADPYVFNIAINTETAKRKGIKDGDWICLESVFTKGKVEGMAKLTETIHPEVVAVANCGGHWSKYLPIASKRGKGVCFERLMPHDLNHIDGPSATFDVCVKVKVYKV